MGRGHAPRVGRPWIGFYHDPGMLVRFDKATGRTLARYRVGGRVRGVAIGGGSVWAVSETAGTLSRVILR